MRVLRYLWRLPLLLFAATFGLAGVVLLMGPVGRALTIAGERGDQWGIRNYSALLLRCFGMRATRVGTPLPGAAMFVANHVSWIDITLLHSQRVVGFVAKAEIAKWPLVGWLAGRGGTIYHHRGDNESLHGVLHPMVQRLQSGLAVGVFFDGGTNDGLT